MTEAQHAKNPTAKPPPCFGPRLAAVRRQKGMSQTKVAAAIGLHYQSYRRWEAGETSPYTDGLVRLCRLFQVSPGWLLGLDGSEELETPVLGSVPASELHDAARACLEALAVASTKVRELGRKLEGERVRPAKGRRAAPKAHPA